MSFFDRFSKTASQAPTDTRPQSVAVVPTTPGSVVTRTIEPLVAAVVTTPVAKRVVPETAVELQGHIPLLAQEFAILMQVPDETTCYLLVLDTQIQKASIQALRQTLAQKFSQLHTLSVNADVLSELRSRESGSSKIVQRGVNKQEVTLNVSRAFMLIEEAIKREASDIHIDVIAAGRMAPMVSVRYRVHGKLTEPIIARTEQAVEDMIATIRGLYQNDDFSPASVRHGGTSFDYPVTRRYETMLKPPIKNAEVRFETMPEKNGFFTVMRLNGYDGKTAARKDLKMLGLSADQETDMLHAAGAPNGVIFVVGPTGSGKTTTVTTVLSLDPNARFKRRVSLEIPPESEIPWLSQIPTSEALLDDHVKGILRSDPDEVSAGEARDQDTLGMAFDCAQTGHLTYVTFHANGVFPAFSRMLSDKFEADRGLLSMNNFVRGAFFQTLVGVLCASCKKDAKTHLAPSKLNLLTKKFGLDSDRLFVSHRHKPGDGEPCSSCGGAGIVGRTAAIELVIPTRSMLDHIAAGDINAAELEYRKLRTARYDEPGTHGKTFVEHAIYKVSQGEVCADEVFGVEVLWNYALVPMQEQTARLHAV